MADSRVTLIRSARLKLGEAPRTFDRRQRKYIKPYRPFFGINMATGYKRACDNHPELLARGRVVWAAMAVARTDLFKKGDADGRAVVVYASQLHVHDNLDGVVQAATELGELLNKKRPTNPIDREWQKRLRNSQDWFPPQRLPGSAANGALLACSLLVVRKHLPNRILSRNCFPVVAHPEIKSIAMLPDRFWPRQMADYWVQAE